MLLILFLLAVPILVYGLRAVMKKNEEFTKVAKVSRLVFISLVFLFLGLLSIENLNYYLIGYRSTSIVYLGATIAGITYTLSDRRFILNSFKRTILNLIAVILMMGSGFLVIEMLEDFEEQLIYSDSRFRLESIDRAPMSPCGLPVLFIKTGLFERKCEIMTPDTCISETNISTINIKDIGSGYLVNYSLTNNSKDTTLQLSIKYSKP